MLVVILFLLLLLLRKASVVVFLRNARLVGHYETQGITIRFLGKPVLFVPDLYEKIGQRHNIVLVPVVRHRFQSPIGRGRIQLRIVNDHFHQRGKQFLGVLLLVHAVGGKLLVAFGYPAQEGFGIQSLSSASSPPHAYSLAPKRLEPRGYQSAFPVYQYFIVDNVFVLFVPTLQVIDSLQQIQQLFGKRRIPSRRVSRCLGVVRKEEAPVPVERPVAWIRHERRGGRHVVHFFLKLHDPLQVLQEGL
mmetsp:Transcript_2472/g.5766  ORF Transcript_2472/g.5766 Transcript_2472/m.5766 type:complete len:247 (+) Transcript_2472:1256-1996(+)